MTSPFFRFAVFVFDRIFYVYSSSLSCRAISAVFSGLFFIVSRKKIITHVICYALIENGVFILSLAVGNEMPLLVNLGVLLDVFISIFLLGIFINKIGNVINEGSVAELSSIKD